MKKPTQVGDGISPGAAGLPQGERHGGDLKAGLAPVPAKCKPTGKARGLYVLLEHITHKESLNVENITEPMQGTGEFSPGRNREREGRRAIRLYKQTMIRSVNEIAVQPHLKLLNHLRHLANRSNCA